MPGFADVEPEDSGRTFSSVRAPQGALLLPCSARRVFFYDSFIAVHFVYGYKTGKKTTLQMDGAVIGRLFLTQPQKFVPSPSLYFPELTQRLLQNEWTHYNLSPYEVSQWFTR